MSSPLSQTDSLVMSYLDLRKAIGIIGIALPFVLAFGKIILESPGIENSISSYYYTVMRDVFVGSLSAIAVFLMSYRGYGRQDRIAGLLAYISALGVAFFPIAPEPTATAEQIVVGTMHLLFATAFFLTLAFFTLFLFRKTDPSKPMTEKKRQRNMVYTACGYGIVASILLIATLRSLPGDLPHSRLNPVFWLESAATLFFGVSWFVKGEAILKDEEEAVSS